MGLGRIVSYVYTYSCPDTGIVRYVGAGKAKRCYRWRSRGPSVVRQCERRTTSPLWISIAITPAAFEAIAVTLPLGSVGYEAQLDAQGQRPIWLEGTIVARLTAFVRFGRAVP